MPSQVCRSASILLLVLPPLVSGVLLERSTVARLQSDTQETCPSGEAVFECRSPHLGLLQNGARARGLQRTKATANQKAGVRDLALVHVPYNFGHTVEYIAMFGPNDKEVHDFGSTTGPDSRYLASLANRQASWKEVRKLAQPRGEIWGHFNPDLQVVNRITNCPMYFTPQKYWPEGLASKYFANKTRFGMLRDPYERLVAFFRGNIKGYGGNFPEFTKTCNVNGAVKQMLKEYTSGNRFANGCTLLPQAEFFDEPYGINLPINNRLFPQSMNEAFDEHGYPDFRIKTKDIFHVTGCPDVWAADLDAETRKLVKEVYARDFELLCKHFGYCDKDENACIYQVPQMCPKHVMDMGYVGRPLNRTS